MKIPRGTGPRGGPSGRPNDRAPKQRPINYYAILAVSPDSSIEEIRAGYWDRIAQYHPDRHSSTHAHAIEALINEAWEVLRDEGRRRLYDIELGTAPRSAGVRAKAPSTAALEANRRASSRVKTLVTTWVTTPARVRTEFSATSTCVDLSVNGMAFTLGRALKVGSVVTATLQLPDGSLNVAATVVRAEALNRVGRWKIAARFSELSGPDRQRVAEYLADERRSRLE